MRLPRGSVALALVALAALLDLRVALRPNLPPISDDVMRAAVEKLDQIAKPGDLLVHSPLFTVRELSALGARQASPARPAEPLRKSRRVVVLDRADQPMFGLGRPATSEPVVLGSGRSTGLAIDVHEPEGSFDLIVYQLQDSILPSTMRVERPLGTITSRCNERRAEGGYQCLGEPEWLYIAPRSLTIDNQESACVWAHPTTGGVIVWELPAQRPPPPGRELILRLAAGLTDDAVRMTPDGAYVNTDVVQGWRSKGAVTVTNQIGWQRASIGLDPGLPIELRVTTPRDGRRHHCITAEIVELETPANKSGSAP